MKKNLFIISTVFIIQICNAQTIDYFGQTPVGDTAKVFAPGIISLTNRLEIGISFSPDGNECYFKVWDMGSKCYYTKRANNTWSAHVEVPIFSAFSCPVFSRDGNRLYFSKDDDIWKVERIIGGWGEPQKLPEPINSSSGDNSYTETLDSVGYFYSYRSGGFGGGDIWCIRPMSNKAENLGPIVNSTSYECDPCVAPDGSYLIFSSDRTGKYGIQDLYICFNKGNNEWTTPVNMEINGAKINIANYGQVYPSLSPDEKFLFFVRHNSTGTSGDIYWVSTSIIDDLKKLALPTGINNSKDKGMVPVEMKLNQNYPNPFNPSTNIQYTLGKTSQVKLSIYNLLGQKIKTLVNSFQNAGEHSLVWNATDDKNSSVSSGVYFYCLETNKTTLQRKMLLLR